LRQSTFNSDVMLLPLGGCDLVLGIEWLVTLGVLCGISTGW